MAADNKNLEPENSPIEFKILFRDEHLIAIEKPHGFHVHQPEMARRRVSPDIVCLPILRRQIEHQSLKKLRALAEAGNVRDVA